MAMTPEQAADDTAAAARRSPMKTNTTTPQTANEAALLIHLSSRINATRAKIKVGTGGQLTTLEHIFSEAGIVGPEAKAEAFCDDAAQRIWNALCWLYVADPDGLIALLAADDAQAASVSSATDGKTVEPDMVKAFDTTKPPIGLRPKSVLDDDRVNEILDAIARYREAGHRVPASWFAELRDLLTKTCRIASV